ncbi:helix-turn-helix domain-containing protein [Cytobacillus praedii]|uniref:helix-turn-helix domain-containing protein n=1 Tax=Cytobacillus praedii TaxID=1742358 RepID=UPI003F7EFAD2
MRALILIQDLKDITVQLIQEIDESEMIGQITVVDNYYEALQLIKRDEYKLIVAMTTNKTLPSQWNVKELQEHGGCTTMSLTCISNIGHLSVLSFVKSLLSTEEALENNSIHNKSLQFIEENLYNEELCLEKAAAHVYLSKCHYSRIFKEKHGVGFKQYIISKRIERAKFLLQNGVNVTDVCFSVGYNDLTHFGRIFKKNVGVNPSEFKRRYLKIS